MEAIDNSQCLTAWDQLYANHSFESLESLGRGQSFSVCSDVKERQEIINYMAAYDVADKAKAEELGLSIKKLQKLRICQSRELYQPASTMPGNMSWKSFFQKLAITTQEPDFEVYTEETCPLPDYQMELWIPVVK